MSFLAPEFEDEYRHRYTLDDALAKWVEMLAAAGANGLPSDPSLHVNYARALGVTLDDFYLVLRMALGNGQMVIVEPPPPPEEPAPEPLPETLPAPPPPPPEPEPEL
jgi:hypothetical protein